MELQLPQLRRRAQRQRARPAAHPVVDLRGRRRQRRKPDLPADPGLRRGVCVLELPDRAAAIHWAAKIAKACRCAQELREFQYDPES